MPVLWFFERGRTQPRNYNHETIIKCTRPNTELGKDNGIDA